MPPQATPTHLLTGASVIVIDLAGRVLLQLRDKDLPEDRYPDQWSIPGGMMHPGEAPADAAVREFLEETSYQLCSLNPFDVFRRASNMPTLAVAEAHVFYTYDAVAEGKIVVTEGQEFRYHRPENLGELAMPPPWRDILLQFLASPYYTFGGKHV